MKFDPFASVQRDLDALEMKGLLRRPSVPSGLRVMCSNDYLGLGGEVVVGTGLAGSGASPLVSGYTDVHAEASESLREWLGTESVTLFTAGYTANVGVLQAIGGDGVVLVSDALNHASIIDGCRLSRSRVSVVRHLDLDHLERTLREIRAGHAGPCWVVTESYFSMDGDGPDLVAVRALCDRFDAGLVVDEAHAIGVYGPAGRGVAAACGVTPDILIGTLGKSLGLHGAFAAGPSVLRTLLWNRARSLVFSTAASPLVLGLVPERVRRVREGDDLRRRLEDRVRALRHVLTTLGSDRLLGAGPIAPLVVGSVERALSLAGKLESRGWLVKPMRPPTVPDRASRLRFTATLNHSQEVVEAFLRDLGDVCADAPIASRTPNSVP